MQFTFQGTVPESLDGMRLDKVLAVLHEGISRAILTRWVKQGFVAVDGEIIKPSAKVMQGQLLTIDAPLEEQVSDAPEDIPIDIVFEDEHLIVINKPAGLVVHPGAGNKHGTLLNALLHHVPEIATLPRAGIIHRLDKDTSGLLVIAKTLESHTALTAALSLREIHREYRTVVWGVMISGGTVDAPLGRHPRDRIKRAVLENGGKPAITHYRIIERFQKHTYLKVILETGRTHQIRVHLAHIGFPVVGDPLYGTRYRTNAIQRQALHAYALRFLHPVTQAPLEFEAPVPQDFQDLVSSLAV